jgi:hypothetical protein
MPHERAKFYIKWRILLKRVLMTFKLQTRDNGKPLAETRGLTLSAAATAVMWQRRVKP